MGNMSRLLCSARDNSWRSFRLSRNKRQPGADGCDTEKPGVPGVQHPMSIIVPDAEYAINGNPDWLAMGEDQVWVNSKPTDFVFRMDPDTNQVVATVPVKKPCSGLMVAAGTLWAPSCEENVIYRIDMKTNQVVAKVPVGPANNEGGIAFGAGSAGCRATRRASSLASIRQPTRSRPKSKSRPDHLPRSSATGWCGFRAPRRIWFP